MPGNIVLSDLPQSNIRSPFCDSQDKSAWQDRSCAKNTSQCMLESEMNIIMINADGERDDIQQQLQSKKQDLVENYVREQQKLYAEILPEVCC